MAATKYDQSKYAAFDSRWNTATFVGAILLAMMTAAVFEPPPALTKKVLFRSLEARGDFPPMPADRRIALGVNTCVDLVVPALELVAAVGLGSDAVEPKDHTTVATIEQVGQTFGHFFSQGAAAERFVTDEALFAKLVAAASELPSAEFRVGGNAALMGQRLARDGAQVVLGGAVGAKLKALLPNNVELVSDAAATTDEVHLILEYPDKAEWAGLTSTRANRLILSPKTDLNAAAAAELAAALPGLKPQMLVLSGLQLLEGKPAAHRAERLASVRALSAAAPEGTKVHIELASLAEEALTKDIVGTLFSHADSIGLNEEELAALFTATGGNGADLPNTLKLTTGNSAGEEKGLKSILSWRIVTVVREQIRKLKAMAGVAKAPSAPAEDSDADPLAVLKGKSPDVAAVAAAISHVLDKTRRGRVSRVHFHALGYHIVARTVGTRELWGGANVTMASVSRGSVRATLQACNATVESDLHGDDLRLEMGISAIKVHAAGADEAEPPLKISEAEPVAQWHAGDVRFFLAPVLVCSEPKVTVGLGDAISAAAISAYFQ